MTYDVILTEDARTDLKYLYDFVLEQELERDGGDVQLAERAYDAIDAAISALGRTPLAYRRVFGSVESA